MDRLISPTDLAWLAGLLEGEGCFTARRRQDGSLYPRITLSMTDKDVVARAAAVLGCSFTMYQSDLSKAKGHKPMFRAEVFGLEASAMMRLVLPFMGERRSLRISTILEGAKDGCRQVNPRRS